MSFGQKRRQLMIFLWILLNWLLWTKNLCFWRGHTCSTWLVENSASIIFHIFIFEPWNFFTDGFAHSPRLVLDQMTLHRYCGPLSFRCQHCPHRGRGNSSHFLFHRHAPNAVQTGKGETFYQYFFSQRGSDVRHHRRIWPRIQGWRSSMNRQFNPIYPNPTARAKQCSQIVWSESSFIDSSLRRPIEGGTCFPHLARTCMDCKTFENKIKEAFQTLLESHALPG